jgi:hypothetical protein
MVQYRHRCFSKNHSFRDLPTPLFLGGRTLILSNITAEQILTTLAGTVAFLPVTVCTGYLGGWLTDLHGFRRRSLVERLLWSIPLSIAITTITSVLVGRFLSLTVAATLVLLTLLGCIVVLALEHLRLRRSATKWFIGFRPYGPTVVLLALFFVAFEVLSLVDFQTGQRLHLSLTFYDIAPRTNWAGSVLRTGIPPANPFYFYLHAANLRYYYFWLVDCSIVAKISHLPMRSIVNASCIWAGFALTALTGLYLKHFLAVGIRLRRQFLIAAMLPAVAGLSLCIYLFNILLLHVPPPGDAWASGQITDFVIFVLFYPHHLVSMLCCMFAFLLAWMYFDPVQASGPPAAHLPQTATRRDRAVTIFFTALALASAFGLSVYVAFAFFLVMLCWAAWQILFQHARWAPLPLFAAGAIAAILLLPYLREITHSDSKMYGGSPFIFSIRETIPPDRLAHSLLLHPIALVSPNAARAIAKIILLPPGFALELGFYFLVLVIFLVPAWRGRNPLSRPHRTLLFIVLATVPITSLIRSAVLGINDFGVHSVLFMQFPLLLLASELLIALKLHRTNPADTVPTSIIGVPPRAMRSLITLALLIGILGSIWRASLLRFLIPVAEMAATAATNPHVAGLAHKAYISHLGYAELNRRIAPDAIVQFNPVDDWMFWRNIDLASINHQTAISADKIWCGSELGGDPSGCPAMLSDIIPLFNQARGPQAHSVCRTWRINYLVATIYDPVWQDPNSWVWTLNPIVADPEFRALNCGQQTGEQ